MLDMDIITQLIRARQPVEIPQEVAQLHLTMTRLLAQGGPVSPQQLAQALGKSLEFVVNAFEQLRHSGCEFNDQGDLIGAALTLSQTDHQIEIDGLKLHTWCALDTLFIPAYIDKIARVTSKCPQTGTPISLTVTPDRIDDASPTETVLSIVTETSCTAGIEGTFCSQVYFLASHDAAKQWMGIRPNFAILTIAEAYTLAQEIYIEPMLKAV
jgi:alkylmercury lyase